MRPTYVLSIANRTYFSQMEILLHFVSGSVPIVYSSVQMRSFMFLTTDNDGSGDSVIFSTFDYASGVAYSIGRIGSNDHRLVLRFLHSILVPNVVIRETSFRLLVFRRIAYKKVSMTFSRSHPSSNEAKDLPSGRPWKSRASKA